MLPHLKNLSIRGLSWAVSESFGVALLSLGVFTLMARLLEPEYFGVVALAGVFIFSFNMIIGHSFADAIVQRLTLEPEHMDTAFWANLAVAILLAAVCFVAADYAARRFGEPSLAEVLPWLSLVIPLNAIGIVQMALFRRQLRFRVIALRSLAGRAIGSAVGIGMALGGCGVWSLVGQQLAGTAIVGIAVAAASPWRPGLRFSIPHLKSLWSFGFNVSASQVVTGLGEQTVNLLIGTIFGSVLLGYFNVAWRIAELIRSLIARAVYHVGFSAFARLQEDRSAVAQAFLQATRLSCLFGFPIGVGMALLSGPLVHVMFGEKWAASIPVLTILAFHVLPAFYSMFCSSCYRAMDHAGWVLGLSLLYLAVGIAAILAAAPFGLAAIAAGWVAKSILLQPVHIVLLRRMLKVSVADLVAPVVAPLAASAVMAGVLLVLLSGPFGAMGDLGRLLLAIPIGALVYAGTIFLMAPRLFRTAARTARIMVTPQGAAGG